MCSPFDTNSTIMYSTQTKGNENDRNLTYLLKPNF